VIPDMRRNIIVRCKCLSRLHTKSLKLERLAHSYQYSLRQFPPTAKAVGFLVCFSLSPQL
jgi:hypothetical protein